MPTASLDASAVIVPSLLQIIAVSNEIVRLAASDRALHHAVESQAHQDFEVQMRPMGAQPKAVAAARAGRFPTVAEHGVTSLALTAA